MSDRPSFLDLGESDAIAALLAEIDAPPAERERQRFRDDTPIAQAAGLVSPLAFAERPPKPDVPPPLPLPEAFEAVADSLTVVGRAAGETLTTIPWRNPAPQVPEPDVPPEPERVLAPWLDDEPPILAEPVPTGRYRIGEFLTSLNWRNGDKPPALPQRLEALIPPPPKPGLFEDPDADAGQRRGRQFSVAEVMGQFAFD